MSLKFKKMIDKDAVMETFQFIDSITPRERKFLELRFIQGKTYEEVGKEFDITRERVRQIEEKALKKVRDFTSKKSMTALEWLSKRSEIIKQKKIDEMRKQGQEAVTINHQQIHNEALCDFFDACGLEAKVSPEAM